jgi:hypothetical protein
MFSSPAYVHKLGGDGGKECNANQDCQKSDLRRAQGHEHGCHALLYIIVSLLFVDREMIESTEVEGKTGRPTSCLANSAHSSFCLSGINHVTSSLYRHFT